MNHKMTLLMICLVMAGCALPGDRSSIPTSQPSAQASADSLRTSLKGFSLYSWKDDSNGSYNYALLEATNATPDLARVRQAGSADLSALLKQFKTIKAGESVFWNFQVASISSLHFALPPAEVTQRIRDAASQQGLKLEIDPFYAKAAG